MMQVEFTATAEEDLMETLHFYRAPSAMGDSFNAMVADVVAYLTQWPYTGHRRRDLTREDVCFWTENPYLFVLQIRGEVLTIVAVLHASRNVARILRKRLQAKPRDATR
jgi:plasmid stabilization system protein ParE